MPRRPQGIMFPWSVQPKLCLNYSRVPLCPHSEEFLHGLWLFSLQVERHRAHACLSLTSQAWGFEPCTPKEKPACFWGQGLAHRVTTTLHPFIVSQWSTLFGWGPAKIYARAWFSALRLISLVSAGAQAVCACESPWHSLLEISVNRKLI